MNTEAALIIVCVLVGQEVLKLVTGYFFKRVTRDDFITKDECSKCSKEDDTTLKRLAADIATVKGLLLALAMNKDLSAEDLTKLMGGQQ